MAHSFDVAVVGAGIVGLATARAVAERLPGAAICVLEKEGVVGAHQTGHNSGVIHTGLYYAPGSLKARLCVEGHRLMREFCEDEGITVRRCGKVVVATSEEGLPRLEELYLRGTANGLRGLRRLDADGLREIEPHAAGLAGLAVPDACAVDFSAVAERMAEGLTGEVVLESPLEAVNVGKANSRVLLSAGGRTIRARLLVNCAGLYSDQVARLSGAEVDVRIIPFRGEYYKLTERAAAKVKSHIYPVPDPAFPFLGVHFTRRVDDTVEVGPNAVLALGKEHYRGSSPNLSECAAMLGFPGFWRLARRNWRAGATEFRRRSRRGFARSAQALMPALTMADLRPGGSGVRAQAVTRSGRLVDGFLIEHTPGCLHVLNAPSPAATASLAIGRHVAALAVERLCPPRRGGSQPGR